MNFKTFSDLVSKQFTAISKNKLLFQSSINGNSLWDIYISSFKEENNPVFRDPQSSTHNCNLDKNFIRRYGNVVAINEDLSISTIWDIVIDETSQFYDSAIAMQKALKGAEIKDVFMETYNELNSLPYEKCNKTQQVFRLGIATNHKMYTKEEASKYGVVKEGEVYEFNHFYADLIKDCVSFTSDSIESIKANFRDDKNVLKRALDEIPSDTLQLVKELILQDSLLNGTTHVVKVDSMLDLKRDYASIPNVLKDNWTWLKSHKFQFAKFRNELIGVLCTELAEGMDLNLACLNWNKRVDPANYMKAKAPISKTQIALAQKFVEENGYEESFDRRFAVIEDISVSEVIHAGTQDSKIKKVSIFDKVAKKASTRHKRAEFDGLEEVTIEKFMTDILPNCTSVEVMVENRMKGNMVTLTTSNNTDTKGIFKWNNNFSWTYNGNLSGKSQLTEAVESRGGKTDGVFRFSHSWNELERNESLMDLHVFLPGSTQTNESNGVKYGNSKRVGWNNRTHPSSLGRQDVDYTMQATEGFVPVENITFPDLNRLKDGLYVCKIHNWAFRKSGGRGRAEIAFEGVVYNYIYPKTTNKEWVTVAEVTLNNGKFSINHILETESETSQDIWGVETNSFHKVNLVSLSPNHWGENVSGDKHYFFMIDGCKADIDIRSFHNDNLNSDLVPHRKVMDTLGITMQLAPDHSQQLAGLGFNSTVRDELIVKVEGSFKRMLKIKF